MAEQSGTDGAELEALAVEGREFAANMAEAMEISQEIWQKFLQAHADDEPAANPDPLNIWPAFAELGRVMLENPQQIAKPRVNGVKNEIPLRPTKCYRREAYNAMLTKNTMSHLIKMTCLGAGVGFAAVLALALTII